jgi:hypothetical protein
LSFGLSAFQGVFTLKYELNRQLQKAEVKRPSAAEVLIIEQQTFLAMFKTKSITQL